MGFSKISNCESGYCKRTCREKITGQPKGMKQLFIGLTLVFSIIFSVLGQENNIIKENERKGQFYFYWGYNRSIYSKTNLHFTSANYDFTVYNIEATDKP